MKTLITRLLLSALSLLTGTLAMAQPDDMPPIPEEKLEEIKAQKVAYITQKMGFTPEEAQKFWPVYDAFQRKLDANNRRYSLAIQEGVMANRISDLHARNLAKELVEIEDAEARARKTLYTGTVKALPGRKAIRYLQVESKLQSAYHYEVASTLPLVK